MSVLDRFLRYVRYYTQSNETSQTNPITAKKLVLLTDLAAELRELGAADFSLDEHGYVMATIPPAAGAAAVPAIGFIAHVDTSPEMSGADVKPIVHGAYDGRDLVLPDAPDVVLRLKDIPELGEQMGHDIVTASLPADRLSPETTAGCEGFVHPYLLNASVDRTSVKLIVRDFVTERLKEKEALLTRLAEEAIARFPGARLEIAVEEQYRNMREVLERHPGVVERARTAIRQAGLQPRSRAIRGGTDGSQLSFMGLPTPNLFAGEHNFHSRYEWVSVQDMEKAVEVIVNLVRLTTAD